ncbi:MAG: ECF-type sigma factor [Phycisphaerales bacterium]
MGTEIDATALAKGVAAGSLEATARLSDLLYTELRALAATALLREHPGHTLQATALAHEALLRLLGQRELDWKNKAHVMALAAITIRRVLVDHARGKLRQKRGGSAPKMSEDRVVLEDVSDVAAAASGVDVLALHEALERLAATHERRARVVELRFFGGLRVQDVAQVLGISDRAVEEDWRLARAWLRTELAKAEHAR